MPCFTPSRSTAPPGDRGLIQIVDAALADATRRSGDWLVCRPGCSQCSVRAFPINQLDAVRLRQGLAELQARAPERAAQLQLRAKDAVRRLAQDFPGDPATGLLSEDAASAARFA